LNHVVFRPYNVYGEGQNVGDPDRNVIGIFMRACLEGSPMTIFGDGEQTRAFSYIDDVAPAIAASVDRPHCWNEAFNIGGAQHYSVNELAHAVADAMGVPHLVTHLPFRHEAVHAYCSNGKAKQFFGDLMPDVPLREGLARMAEWAKQTPLRPTKPFADIEITRNLPPSWR
jgi:UDP-glucose 4-epimerase